MSPNVQLNKFKGKNLGRKSVIKFRNFSPITPGKDLKSLFKLQLNKLNEAKSSEKIVKSK